MDRIQFWIQLAGSRPVGRGSARGFLRRLRLASSRPFCLLSWRTARGFEEARPGGALFPADVLVEGEAVDVSGAGPEDLLEHLQRVSTAFPIAVTARSVDGRRFSFHLDSGLVIPLDDGRDDELTIESACRQGPPAAEAAA